MAAPDFIPYDPELEQAIADAARTQRGTTGISPSKWNNKETRSPLQILQQEGPSANEPDPLQATAAPDFIPYEEPKAEAPDFIPYEDKDASPSVEDRMTQYKKDMANPSSVPVPSLGSLAATPFKLGLGLLDNMPALASMFAGGLGAAVSVPMSLATGKNIGEEASKIYQEANAPEVLQPTTEAGKDVAAMFGIGIDKAKEILSEGGVAFAKALGLPMEAEAAAYALGQATPEAIMMALMKGKPLEVAKDTNKPLVLPPKETPPPPPGAPPPAPPMPEGAVPFDRSLPSRIQKTETPPLGAPEEGRVPYDLNRSGRPVMPQEVRGNEIPYDPLVESQMGEAATPLSARTAGVDMPHQMGLELTPKPEEVSIPKSDLGFDPKQEFERAQQELGLEPKGINKGTFGQSGAVNWDAFRITREEQKPLAEKVMAGFDMLKANYPRFAENTDIVVLDDAQFKARLQRNTKILNAERTPLFYDGKTKEIVLNIDHPGIKTTSPTGVAGVMAHELTHGLQHDRGRFEFWKDPELWEREWKDRPWEKQAEQARETALQRLKYGRREINKGTFGQSGGFNFWTREAEKLPPEKQIELFGLPNQTTAEYMAKNIPPLEDINKRLGLSSGSFRSVTDLIKHMGNASAKLMVHFENQLHKAMQLEHRLNYAHQDTYKGLEKYYGLKAFGQIVTKQFKEDIAFLVDWEKNPQKWFNGKDFYPSDEQMVAMGMKPKSAAVWRKVFDSMEMQWKTLEETAKMNGREVPPRIPGYIHHIWKGPYEVLLERTYINEDGSTTVQHVGEYNYNTLKEAKAAEATIRKLAEAHEGVTTRIHKPNPEGSGVSELLEGLWRAKDRLEGVKGLEALVKSIYDSTAKGIVSSVLDRASTAKIGHLLERVNEEGVRGLSPEGIKDAIRSFRNMNEAVNAWHARAKIVNETLFPLEQGGYFDPKNNPKAAAAAREYLENYFKIPRKIARDFDLWLQDKLVNHGLDPALAHAIGAKMNSGFAWYYLAGNWTFYAANALQFTISVPTMMMLKSFGDLHGEKTGSILKALLSAEVKNAVTLSKKDPLVNYAAANGHIDPVGIEHLQPGAVADPINMGIERRTRMMSFNLGYAYAKQIMSHEEALAFAGKFTDLVGVPYSKQLGAPSLMARLPIVGSAFTMFMTYQQHMLGLLNQQLQITKQAAYKGNTKALAEGISSMVGLQALNISIFGLTGIAFGQNWDSIVTLVNQIFKTEYPTVKDMGRQLDDKFNTNGILQHGAISKATGYDISTSGSGPSVNAPTAAYQGAATLIMGAVLGSRMLGGENVSDKAKWEWARTLPKVVQGPMEYMIKEPHYSDVVDRVMGTSKTKDYTAMKDINEHGIERTRAQTLWRILTGLKSTQETSFNASVSLDNMHEMQQKAIISEQLQWLKEAKVFGVKEQRIILDLALKAGKDPDEIIDAIIEYKISNQMHPDTRKAMDTNSLEGIFRYKRYMEQRRLEKP